MTTSRRTAVVALGLMAGASIVGLAFDPTRIVAAPTKQAEKFDDIVPTRFGPWHEVPQSTTLVVNPQAQQLLDKIYSQMLNRTYVNDRGYHVMLSLAYGDDQRGGLQAHLPEVCYPAQGFTVASQTARPIATPFGAVSAQRLEMSRGSRVEPVTYWFNFGDVVLRSGSRLERRLIELRLSLTGRVPDGMLVRVSSIDADSATAFTQHDRFVVDLLSALTEVQRQRFIGLPVTTTP